MQNYKEKKFKGIIFDFNGTLLWDTQLHNHAWDIFLEKYNIRLSNNDKNNVIHGKTNEEILKIIFNNTLTKKEMFNLSEEKEALYRKLFRDTNPELAEGAVELFQFCISNNIKTAIATSSCKSNVDFYIKRYNLLNWFKPEFIVYDDGTLKSKPDPGIYLHTINKMELDKKDIIIFEDSVSGINAALNSKAGKVIIVNSGKNNFNIRSCERINSFTEFNYKNLT